MAGIAEVREGDASPEIARTYALIKADSGLPQLNLIWRHFATEPAVLGWAWDAMGASFRSGLIGRTASALESDLAAITHRPVWQGLSPDIARNIEDLTAFYNQGNTQNLISLTALLVWARGEGKPNETANVLPNVTSAPTAARPLSIPPLPKRDELAGDTLRTVDRLAGRHGGASIGVTPSMYLHLALWPDVLAAVDERLAGVVASEAFAGEVQRVIHVGRAHAAVVASTLSARAPRPPAATLDPMLETLENFVSKTIPEMIVVGRLLSGGDLRATA